MTGGDQKRLLARIGGTPAAAAIHRAHRRGACIAGTSAWAVAIAEHMLAYGTSHNAPERGAVHLSAGLGFLRRVTIDSHFSERRRLSLLLTLVAENPYLLGIGIDDDTALVIRPERELEVAGDTTAEPDAEEVEEAPVADDATAEADVAEAPAEEPAPEADAPSEDKT